MDTGSKSLAQLSEEGKEKKYVTLEVGSKVSGYTKDYLERLCRLRKVEYLLRNEGDFAIELESLLRETHTILLSYEGITFIEKTSLVTPTESTPPDTQSSTGFVHVHQLPDLGGREDFVQPIPRFGDVNKLNSHLSKENPLSYVGRSVVSDGRTPRQTETKEVHVPVGKVDLPLGSDVHTPKDVPHVVKHAPVPESEATTTTAMTSTPPPVVQSGSLEIPQSSISHTTHVDVTMDEKEEEVPVHAIVNVLPTPAQREGVEPFTMTESTPVEPQKVEHIHDDWDALLFGASAPVQGASSGARKEVSAPTPVLSHELHDVLQKDNLSLAHSEGRVPPLSIAKADQESVYRPIRTSIDASVHHEDAPLLPPLSKEPLPPRSPTVVSNFVPPPGQKVVVFDPHGFIKNIPSGDHAESSVAPKSPFVAISTPVIPRADERVIQVLSADQGDTKDKDKNEMTERVPASTVPDLSPSSPVRDTPILAKAEDVAPPRVVTQSKLVSFLAPSPVLPAPPSPHTLALRPDNAVASRPSFGMMLSVVGGFASLAVLGGSLLSFMGVELNSSSYVASVGSSEKNDEMTFLGSDEHILSKELLLRLNNTSRNDPVATDPTASSSVPDVLE